MIDPHQKDLAIRRYRPQDAEAWNSFAAAARNTNFLFSRSYMDYHQDRFTDHSLIIERHGAIFALLPANESGGRLVSHAGLTFGGLLVNDRFRLAHAMEFFKSLQEYGRKVGLRGLIYRPAPHCYHALPTEEDIIALLRLGGRLTDAKPTSVLRFGRPGATRRSRPKETAHAVNLGIEVQLDHDYRTFMAICADTIARRYGGRPVHSEAEITLLADRFPENITLLTARRKGAMIGGVIVYDNLCCSRLQYVGVIESERRSGVGTALHLAAIARAAGRRSFFDFGASVDPRSDEVNLDLVFAKESYGARTLMQASYELEFQLA